MIKLNRPAKPAELTSAFQSTQTAAFKSTGASVWNEDFIKKALLAFSNDKCCYCEANINEESKYMEVEHFYDKNTYPDDVLEWTNLLPACKRCNTTKGDHDTKAAPIINPTLQDPKDHLAYKVYRIRAKDALGRMTIDTLNLNNQNRLVKKRYEIGNALIEKLEELNELADEYISGVSATTRRRNRIVNGIKALMEEGLPPAIYSATSASVILNEEEFSSLKKKLQSLGLWDNSFQTLENELSAIAL